jgi:hypothetical protein
MAHPRLIDGDKIFNPQPVIELQNIMPFQIVVILLEGEFGKGSYSILATLRANESKSVAFPGTSYDTKIASIQSTQSKALLTEPIYFGRGATKYFFGAVAWNSSEMDTNMYNLYADISGVRIYNHFPFEVQLNYRNLVFKVPPKGWRDYVGGSPGVIYFDNQGSGLTIGDLFDVVIPKQGLLLQFKIPNRLSKCIHIGMTSVP